MVTINCKICGNPIIVEDNTPVGECLVCHVKQTLPVKNVEKTSYLYDIANHFRVKKEFDKAENICRDILSKAPDDAESYWGMLLCKYGIVFKKNSDGEYDPKITALSDESIFNDNLYISALQYASPEQRELYKSKAASIEKDREEGIAIAKEQPSYDIFLLSKETNSKGQESGDMARAREILALLKEKNYKVFFPGKLLKGKNEFEREPYIYSAINSCRVMLVIGSRPDFFTRPGFKSVWKRFFDKGSVDSNKKTIPIYKDMKRYDLPEEFFLTRTLDYTSETFKDDLYALIDRYLDNSGEDVESGQVTLEEILQKASEKVKAGEFDEVRILCDKAVSRDKKCAKAYLYKLLAEFGCKSAEELAESEAVFELSENYVNAKKCGDEEVDKILSSLVDDTKRNTDDINKERQYIDAVMIISAARNVEQLKDAEKTLVKLGDYKDSKEKLAKCREIISNGMTEIESYSAREAQEEQEFKQFVKVNKIKLITVSCLLLIAAVVLFIVFGIVIPKRNAEDATKSIPDVNTRTDSVCLAKLGKEFDGVEVINGLAKYLSWTDKLGMGIEFGKWEQDGDTSNGPEPISWKVLDSNADYTLLITEKVIDSSKFFTTYRATSWNRSTLKSWLNEEFLSGAFSEEEAKLIEKYTRSVSDNLVNETTDSPIFILTEDEAAYYFKDDSERKAQATPYAAAGGLNLDAAGCSSWWLCTSGSSRYGAAAINSDGSINYSGVGVSSIDGVRPCILVKTEDLNSMIK